MFYIFSSLNNYNVRFSHEKTQHYNHVCRQIACSFIRHHFVMLQCCCLNPYFCNFHDTPCYSDNKTNEYHIKIIVPRCEKNLFFCFPTMVRNKPDCIATKDSYISFKISGLETRSRDIISELSRDVRKPDICICENKDADQLRGYYREADQRLCFRYIDSTIPLLSKSEISSL